MSRNHTGWLLLALLGLALAGCSGDRAQEEELAELRARIEQLERENRELGQPLTTPEELAARFANDPTRGTLAGLLPGDQLSRAHERFGPEDGTRSWRSEGREITQYEWHFEAGLRLRVNADSNERLEKVAVVLADPQGVNIPTLAGLTIGGETFLTLEERFGPGLRTDLHIWGARGLYTVAQRTPYPPDAPDTRWRLEFAYQLPSDLGQGALDLIEQEVHLRRNPGVLHPYLGDRAPYLLALEEVR